MYPRIFHFFGQFEALCLHSKSSFRQVQDLRRRLKLIEPGTCISQCLRKLHNPPVRLDKQGCKIVPLPLPICHAFLSIALLLPLPEKALALRWRLFSLMGFDPFLNRDHQQREARLAQGAGIATSFLGNIILADGSSLGQYLGDAELQAFKGLPKALLRTGCLVWLLF